MVKTDFQNEVLLAEQEGTLLQEEEQTNGFGVKVKMCCASCMHKSVENDGTRVCQLMQLKVKQGFKCSKWQMDLSCDKAGLGLGKVKKKAYLLFVLAVRCRENEAIQKGIITEQDCRSLEQLREEFTKEQGSIWDIH